MNELNRFDRIAPFYDLLVRIVFGYSLSNARKTHLHRIKKTDHVLILGGGTGNVLKEILSNHKDQNVTYVEASHKMIQICRDKIETHNSGSVKFIHASDISLLNEDRFDVIITNFFLDLFEDKELKIVGNTIHDLLKKGGLWIFSDFRISEKNGLWQRYLIGFMYGFFRIVSGLKTKKLPDFHSFFGSKNLDHLNSVYYYGKMIESSVYKKS